VTVARRALAVGAVLLALAACGDTDDDGDLEADPVAAAQQDLDEAETALDEANAALDESSAGFCDESVEYIEAVDRYGGLVSDAEATVGDVTTAGADLEQPRDAVTSSADEVRQAGEDLAEAEQQLADAQVALAEAQTGTTGPPADDTTTTTEPVVPDEAVERVERAEADLRAAFEGVDESTPLSEATQQVNAAAVSVEVAWMQLFAAAGCLSDEEQHEVVTAVADYTRALQSALTTAGYHEGEIDGVYGPATVEAVERLQADAGLPVTGLVDRATAEALDEAVTAAGGDAAAAELAHTAALQTVLTVTGHWTGPIDGEWTDALTAALQAFQTDLGVEPTGVIDPATIAAAQRALEEARTPATPTTTEADEVNTTSSTGP
jgi:murein L,D-transpeptidase YcbB/YkuD